MEEITTLITTVGFPIACVIALGFFIYKAFNQITTENKEREEKLYSLIGSCQKELEEAQKTNASFVAILDTYKTDIKEIKNDIEDIKNTIKEE